MRSRRSALSFLVAASLADLAGTARAANFDVSTKNRFFCCTIPPVFAAGAPVSMGGYHSVVATASVTGTGTPPLKIGMGHAAHFYSMSTTYGGNHGTFSVSNAAGTLQKSGGNLGSFSFCPKAKGPGPGACTKASKATPVGFNGRIKVTPGPNQFGGTLQILAGPGGIGGSQFHIYRLIGGTMLSKLPAQIVTGGVKAAPIGAAPAGVTTRPVTVMTGYPPAFNQLGYFNGALWENGAGPFTTGMVTVQVSKPLLFSVKLAGYDKRTPAGLGNIQVVSGLLSNRVNIPVGGPPPLGWSIKMHVIPEPGPSLGLAAGALSLLCVGAFRARRR